MKLHPFGRNCPPRGPGKSASIDFLGLSHFVSEDLQGRYLVKRNTARKVPMPKIMRPDNGLPVDASYMLGSAGPDAVTPHVRFYEGEIQ
jgi:hypothetical protein